MEQNCCPIKNKIFYFYNEGYGYKSIAKWLDISYSEIRNLLLTFGDFVPRKGRNVVTDKLKIFRAQNVKGKKSPFFDWPKKNPQLISKTSKCVQGYYLRKHDNVLVYLRSTYEYIFAKWLDKNNFIWRIEETSFILSNGERYRPDFFIYENNKLLTIIEIKSRYFNKDNREYKFHMFKEEYNIDCSLVTDIKLFIENGSNYNKELCKWKQSLVKSKQKE